MASRFASVVCISILLALAPALIQPGRAEEPQSVTVEGSIEIAQEDDDGNVVAVYIMDRANGDYLVLGEGRGASLVNHVGRWVEATGVAVPRDEGDGFDHGLRVQSFRFTDGLDDDESAGPNDEGSGEPPESDEERPDDPGGDPDRTEDPDNPERLPR